tara:strand:- start:181 stop:327 length:147 start_codon:yes stop_codon:yes gene_type:complete
MIYDINIVWADMETVFYGLGSVLVGSVGYLIWALYGDNLKIYFDGINW